MPTINKIVIDILADDKGTPVIKHVAAELRKLGSAGTKASNLLLTSWKAHTRVLKGLTSSIFNVKSMLLGLGAAVGAGAIAKSFLDTASSFERLKISLDTLTKGHGEEWFEKLNKWALKMPINTEKAIEAFKNLRAMGIKPNLDQMTTLVDTTLALGGGEDVLLGIARALGQMQTKGKVAAEELMQLAERGVPIFQILKNQLGLTNEQLGKIGKLGLDVNEVIAAIFKGLKETFGGTSAKMMTKYSAELDTLNSYWKEFKRLVMDSGVMDYVEQGLAKIIKKIDALYKEGKLKKWAQETGKAIIDAFSSAAIFAGRTIDQINEKVDKIRAALKSPKEYLKGLAKEELSPGILAIADKAKKQFEELEKMSKEGFWGKAALAPTAFLDLLALLKDFSELDISEGVNHTQRSLQNINKTAIIGKREMGEYEKKVWDFLEALGTLEQKKKVKLDVDTSSLERARAEINALNSSLDELKQKSTEVNVKFTGEASPRKPLSETMSDISDNFQGLIDKVSNITANFDLSGATELLSLATQKANFLMGAASLYRQTAEAYPTVTVPSAIRYVKYQEEMANLMRSVQIALAGSIIRSAGFEFTPPLSLRSQQSQLYLNPYTQTQPVPTTTGRNIEIQPGAFQINVYSDTENLVELAEKVEGAIASNIRTGRSEIFEALNEVTS